MFHEKLLVGIVFIHHIADDFLDNVFKRQDARGAAIFVDNDRQVRLVVPQILQDFADLLGLRNEIRRSHDLADVQVGNAAVAQEILGMNRADDVINALLIDRNAGMATLDDELHDIGNARFRTGEHGIGSRHHDLTGNGIPEREDALDHLPFVFRNQPLLLPFIDQLLNFFFDILGVIHLGKAAEAQFEPMSKSFG